MELQNQQVVIIGGSSGIGLATASLALSYGANVTIAARNQQKLQQSVEKLGSNVGSVVADIMDESQVEQIFQGLERVDHLFVAAGSLEAGGLITGASIEKLKHPIAERIYGAIYAVRHAVPKMTSGSITLMSGLFSSRPMPGSATTAAAVAGIEAMARTLALELSPIRVNAVCPGYIDTSLLANAFGDNYQQVIQSQAATLPAKRIGSAQEVAQSVVFMMTNGFMTGEILHIDGGGRLV